METKGERERLGNGNCLSTSIPSPVLIATFFMVEGMSRISFFIVALGFSNRDIRWPNIQAMQAPKKPANKEERERTHAQNKMVNPTRTNDDWLNSGNNHNRKVHKTLSVMAAVVDADVVAVAGW